MSSYMKLLAIAVATLAMTAAGASAASVVLKQALAAEANAGDNLLPNGGLEQVGPEGVTGWAPWEAGYEVDEQEKHGGQRSVRCSSDDPQIQHGIGYTVELNQQVAAPLVASAWSKAEDVSGSPESNYSLYLDLEFMDGTPLWGQTAKFDCGTHDWQRRTVTVIPPKPVRSVNVYGIFRGKTGTVWFDDFALLTLDLPRGARSFDGVPVLAQPSPPPPSGKRLELKTGDGLQLKLDQATGAVIGEDDRLSGFFWRDAAAQSDFRQPQAALERDGDALVLKAQDEQLKLALDARLTAHDDHIRIEGTVRDLTGEDRAVSVYFALPVDAIGWDWYDDARAHRTIEARRTYSNPVSVRVGPTGLAAKYPLACVSGNERSYTLAVPLDEPRITSLAYDAGSRELYAGFHLGLSAETANFPSQASFALAVYRSDPTWGFRAALDRYYKLFPDCFTKRNEKEGIWMPFTDVSTVEGWQDFGFQFHEGNNNVPFDDQAGIYSFVYVEPASHWLRMPKEMPRTLEAAMALLNKQAEEGNRQALATLSSGVYDASQHLRGSIQNAPWCDGALFALNPEPSLFEDQPERVTQWRYESERLWRAFRQEVMGVAEWRSFGRGYEVAADAGRNGGQAIKCSAAEAGSQHGAAQTVTLKQQAPGPLIARGWSKAEGVTGEPDNGYCIYVDLTYDDGTPLWGQVATFECGTHEWQQAEVRIQPEKPVRTANFHVLFRHQHTGTVYFDDLFLGAEGSDANLLQNPGFEPMQMAPAVLDGIYIDSLEMAASTQNYRREHWRYAQYPLTFATDSARPCQLGIFNTVEFARELSLRLHEQGKMLMANSTPHRFPWAAAWCDVMGTETNWSRREDYEPDSDATFNYRRAMCYQRPYLLLLNTVYEDFAPEWVELYMKRSVAYGVFPSMFSHNAATDKYWERPALYNRDRPLFEKYIPMCAKLNKAGWQPVTHARSSAESVYVERFGPSEDGALYLTVFNDSHEAQTAEIVVEATELGVRAPLAAQELVRGKPITLQAKGKDGVGQVRLGPEDLVVLRLR